MTTKQKRAFKAKQKRAIAKEDALIKKLEASYPPRDETVHQYHENNRAWNIHYTKVRDCYWRKMMARRTPEEVAAGIVAPG